MKFGPETNSKPHIWTWVELAKFNQPELAQTWPVESLIKNYETMKIYKITEKPNNISVFLVKKGSVIWVFIYLGFRTCILFIYRKTTWSKTKKIVF